MMKVFSTGVVAVVIMATQVWAAECGDTTGPGATRVACSCGDIVKTSTTLQNTDPVVSTDPTDTCSGDGLLVATGVTLDCQNLTLRGSGVGRGVRFYSDNPDAAGFRAVQRCTITAFQRGIVFEGYSLRFRVRANTVTGNLGIGIDLGDSSNGKVQKNEVALNGGHGVMTGDGTFFTVFANNHIHHNAGDGLNLFNIYPGSTGKK